MIDRLCWHGLLFGFGLVLCGCQGAATSQPAPVRGADRPAVPNAHAPETSYDFGEVDFTRPYTHTFSVANTGTAPLKLTLTRKSCHCAEVMLPPGDVAPGEKGPVTLRWVPIPGQAGNYTLAADFETNDPQTPRLRFEVKGQVNPLIRVWPEDWFEIDFRQIHPGRPQERQIKVFSTSLSAFDLQATASHPGLEVSTSPLPPDSRVGDHRAASGYAVTVRSTDRLPKGYFRETLRLAVGGEHARQITLPVYGDVETGAVRVAPQEVEFKKPRLTDEDSKRVRVQFLVPSESEKVEITRAEPSFLVVGTPQRLKNGLWEFTVQIPAGNAEAAKLQPDGFFEGRIVLRTSAAAAAEVPLRVRWVRPGGRGAAAP
jgi:hypothetical protein